MQFGLSRQRYLFSQLSLCLHRFGILYGADLLLDTARFRISLVYYDRTYQAAPETGGEKAFELLRGALMAEQKIAIGKTVMGTKDTLMAIIPRDDGILISTMFYADDVKELQKQYNKPEVSEQEMNMAKTLINSMDTPFNPEKYKDEYQEKLLLCPPVQEFLKNPFFGYTRLVSLSIKQVPFLFLRLYLY
jgi:hypothetical protein